MCYGLKFQFCDACQIDRQTKEYKPLSKKLEFEQATLKNDF